MLSTAMERAIISKFSSRMKEQIPAAIIEAQSTEVDSITGVTLTSEGIKEAVENALAQMNK